MVSALVLRFSSCYPAWGQNPFPDLDRISESTRLLEGTTTFFILSPAVRLIREENACAEPPRRPLLC